MVSGFEAGAGHAFAKTAFFEEGLFEPADLPVEQVVGLVDEADRDVRRDFRRARLQIRPIGLIRRILGLPEAILASTMFCLPERAA